MTDKELACKYKTNRDELIEDVKELRNHWAELESYIHYKIYANPSNSQYKKRTT